MNASKFVNWSALKKNIFGNIYWNFSDEIKYLQDTLWNDSIGNFETVLYRYKLSSVLPVAKIRN